MKNRLEWYEKEQGREGGLNHAIAVKEHSRSVADHGVLLLLLLLLSSSGRRRTRACRCRTSSGRRPC